MSELPVIVFQVGKVGSTSVCAALAEAGVSYHHTHSFDPRRPNSRPRKWVRQNERIAKAIQGEGLRWRVVTFVRDPVAQDVSWFWEQFAPRAGAQCFHELDIAKKRSRLPLSVVQKHYSEERNFGRIEAWLRAELGAWFGLDLFATDFDRTEGARVFETENSEVILLKCEDLRTQGIDALGEFLQTRLVVGEHRRSVDRHGSQYTVFRRAIACRYAHEIQAELSFGKVCNKFYSDAEIAEMQRSWTARLAPRDTELG